MEKTELIIVVDYSQDSALTMDELCDALNIPSEFVNDLIEYEIIHPQGSSQADWTFDLIQLNRIKTALRLQRDLEVNLAGIAVVLDLLEDMEKLRERMQLLERYFSTMKHR